MRVGLVVTGGVDRSGRERVIPSLLWLIERLASAHDVHVFALHHEPSPSTYPLLGATVHDLGRAPVMPGLGRPLQRYRLRRAIAAIGGVHVLHGYWGLPASVAVAVAETLKIPSIVTADSGEWVSLPEIGYGLQRHWRDRRAVATAMRGAAVVTVCTQFMQQLAAAHGVTARVIPIGVPQYVGPSFSSADIPARPVEGPPWRLINVASINAVKDHDTLLRAMAGVVERHPDARLDIVGADTLNGHAQRLVASLGLSDHVTFHGFLTNDHVTALWSRAHLHVVSSRHEAAGVVTLEAAMAGVPTVGTRVGYIADGAPHRAVAVPVGDHAALAGAILELIGDPIRRSVLASTARTWAVMHDADSTAAMFDRLYRDVTNA
jgi:glycosyltransferase involved in cell wall biosynthesis